MSIKTIIIALSTVLIQCKKVYDEEIPFSWNTHYTLPVEHAIGQDEQWHSRGEISFKSSRTLTASFTDEVELNDNEIERLRNSAQEGDLYFIRTPIKIGGKFDDNTNGTKYVSSFVKACFLYGSGLNEHIRVSIDLAGNVIGVSISSPRSTCIEDFNGISGVFNSTVTVHQQVSCFPANMFKVQTCLESIIETQGVKYVRS